MRRVGGAVTVSEPEPAVKRSGTKCWSMSTWWVSAPSETRLTAMIDAASGVVTVIVRAVRGGGRAPR